LIGPLPTPALSRADAQLAGDIGVVISASHNPFADNGNQLLRSGWLASCPDEFAAKIESSPEGAKRAPSDRASPCQAARRCGRRYIEFVKQSFPKGPSGSMDCASSSIAEARRCLQVARPCSGSSAPRCSRSRWAPDGLNINRECGALAPSDAPGGCWRGVPIIGIALDGDADRLIMADERGVILDGEPADGADRAEPGAQRAPHGRCAGRNVMSNLGLERCLGGRGSSCTDRGR